MHAETDLRHGFRDTPQGVRFTISRSVRREVLARRLKLNRERYPQKLRKVCMTGNQTAKRRS